MNTIVVWIMLAHSAGGNWIPTLEFKSEQKCITAVATIEKYMEDNGKWLDGNARRPTKCIRIEK